MMKTDPHKSETLKTVLNWVGGSKVVKKNNAQDHLKAKYHITAVQILRERACEK